MHDCQAYTQTHDEIFGKRCSELSYKKIFVKNSSFRETVAGRTRMGQLLENTVWDAPIRSAWLDVPGISLVTRNYFIMLQSKEVLENYCTLGDNRRIEDTHL